MNETRDVTDRNLAEGYSGNDTPPGKAGQQPVPSVACRTEQSEPRSVHRECAGRVIEPRKSFHRRSRRRLTSGRQHFKAAMTWQRSPTGVQEQGMQTEDPPGTWETLTFPLSEQWLGKPRTKQPRPSAGSADSAGRDEQQSTGRYRQAKETKCGGTNGRESEQLVVVVKVGNQTMGPSGAKELPSCGTRGGKDGEASNSVNV